MKFNSIKVFMALVLIALISFSCSKDKLESPNRGDLQLKAVTPKIFDWETADWMPTPPGQSKISVPWIGQGSIASVYDNDVVYDFKKSDGWDLIYNAFDASSSGPLQNPYFILYNKYRGLLRIYVYTTTQFVHPSSYIQDGISIVGVSSSMLNFCGTDIVDASNNNTTVAQIQPKPVDGSMPLASNKWHMLQYALAYDPNISKLTHQQIQFSWFTNFCNVEAVKLNGGITGEIKGTTGKSAKENVMAKLGELGKVSGTMALSGIGSYFVEKKTVNSYYGSNDFNLPHEMWKNLRKGVNSALSSSTKGLPGSVVNLFSAIIGGSSQQTLSFDVNLDVELAGEKSDYGSFPASPTTLYIPGSKISNRAQGYIPLKSYKLGVFNLSSRPLIRVKDEHVFERDGSPREGFRMSHYLEREVIKLNNSNKLQINPDLQKEATVRLVDQDVVFIRTTSTGTISSNGTVESVGKFTKIYVNPTSMTLKGGVGLTPAVRMTIKVTPKNGAPSSIIVKTFLADIEDV
ncbi:hypothetical protein DMA11_13655 [Marinilabiliaceae bacterium JC017]|nr:hypothetical protein DMA11_13655 [Marinilabiliaceae bacterium JC017]